MSDLREDLDRALRTVTFGEAPVERAKRDGRRIRTRRRTTLLALTLGVAAAAAGYPALAGNGAAGRPAPLTGSTTPSPRPSSGHHMTVTAGPPGQTTEAPTGLTDKTGQVAQGTIGDMKWQITVVPPGPKNPVPADSCYTVTVSFQNPGIQGTCYQLPSFWSGLGPSAPALFDEMSDNNTTATIVGEVANDVAFFIVTFSDGQRLKLIPVTVHGHRYVAWLAPLSMTTASITAHLGGPYSDSGQTVTAIPFNQPGGLPDFGLWQAPGQAVPPTGTGVVGAGTTAGHPWKVTAYEGPWGTCFVNQPADTQCVWAAKLDTTGIHGWSSFGQGYSVFGSAAPGVALVRVKLSDGTTVQARPARVGNEYLFGFVTGKGATPTHWTAYNASGNQVSSGSLPPLAEAAPAAR